jgi:hypothetical protein
MSLRACLSAREAKCRPKAGIRVPGGTDRARAGLARPATFRVHTGRCGMIRRRRAEGRPTEDTSTPAGQEPPGQFKVNQRREEDFSAIAAAQ